MVRKKWLTYWSGEQCYGVLRERPYGGEGGEYVVGGGGGE